MSYKKFVFKSALIMGSSTFISRILGFIRDVVIANFLGTSFMADAFFVAFRIPNLLRRLFGEGSLTASFIPVFTKYHIEKGKEEADKIASVSFTLLSIILFFITILGIDFSPVIVKMIAPGFEKFPEKFLLTVKLNRIMFPYIFFISLVALSMGILNSLKHFFAPAIAPAFLNIAIISGAYISYVLKINIVIGISWGVIAGGIIQLILQLIYVKRFKIKIVPNFNFNHPAIKEILLLMGPSVLGLAITQINIFIGTLLASFLPSGSVSYLYYADRLIQFPLGIFAVSIGSAVLPLLSEQHTKNNLEEMEKTFIFAMKLILLIALPATIGLIFAGKPIISFLFQRGVFDINALKNVYIAIIGYSLGLWAYAGIRVLVPLFYAFKDTKTPVKVGFYALIINVFSSIVLMKFFLHFGLALATAISSSFNFILLFLFLKKHIRIDLKEIVSYISKLTIPCIIIVIILTCFQILLPFDFNAKFLIKFLYILFLVGLTIFMYILSCYFFKINEITFLLKKIFKR